VFGLGADIIVGFPGETEEDFAGTVSLVERLPFTYLHVFTYSPRPGTAAMRLPNHVPLSAAQDRSSQLRHLGQAKGNVYRQSRAGAKADAVVITAVPDREAMTEDYLTVKVTGAPRARGDRFTGTLRADGDALVLY
jgi:threonylcarbamoyladenosine tRNA methylthiotransferase MtaB